MPKPSPPWGDGLRGGCIPRTDEADMETIWIITGQSLAGALLGYLAARYARRFI